MLFKKALIVAGAVLMEAGTMTSGIAQASSTPRPVLGTHANASRESVVTGAGDYCVMYLPTGKHACVSQESQLPLARSVVLPGASAATASGKTVAESGDSAPAAAAATWHIGTVWDNGSYNDGRGHYEFFTSGDCTASKTDSNWQDENLSGIGWANRISSFQSCGNCQTRLFSGAIFTGSGYPASGFIANSPDVGGAAMNDHAVSIKWT